jgi:DNA modification methylase
MSYQILIGDVREKLSEIENNSIQICVTSPPYWGLRDYGNDGQIGLEQTPEEYVSTMVEIFNQVWRVLANDGTLWLNLGDSYVGTGNKGLWKDPKYPDGRNAQSVALNNKVKGLKNKDLVGIPWRVAFALQEAGWYLRQDIIWAKPNPMPESVKDRCTKSHEYLFMLTKSAKYYFDNQAIREDAVTGSWEKLPPIGGKKHQENGNPTYSGNQPSNDGKRNKRDVWTINTKPFRGAHFAVMPEALVEPCILAGSRGGGADIVLDPFAGSGTVGVVALKHNRKFIGIELNSEYAEIAQNRIEGKI